MKTAKCLPACTRIVPRQGSLPSGRATAPLYEWFGRFLTPDPAGHSATCLFNPQTQNRYTYVTDNPVNRTDPTGLCGDGDNSDCGGFGITLPIFPGGGSEQPAPPTPHPVLGTLQVLNFFSASERSDTTTPRDCGKEFQDCLSLAHATVDNCLRRAKLVRNLTLAACALESLISPKVGANRAAIRCNYL